MNAAPNMGMFDTTNRMDIYNNNKAAVNWSSSITNKGIKHINLHENKVRKVAHDKIARVLHIAGIINASDIFTKEMKDATHYSLPQYSRHHDGISQEWPHCFLSYSGSSFQETVCIWLLCPRKIFLIKFLFHLDDAARMSLTIFLLVLPTGGC